jgi:hypothetical protein
MEHVAAVSGDNLSDFGEACKSAGILNPVAIYLGGGAIIQSVFKVKSGIGVVRRARIYFLYINLFRLEPELPVPSHFHTIT